MKAIICLHIGAAARNYKGKADKMHQKAPLYGEQAIRRKADCLRG